MISNFIQIDYDKYKRQCSQVARLRDGDITLFAFWDRAAKQKKPVFVWRSDATGGKRTDEVVCVAPNGKRLSIRGGFQSSTLRVDSDGVTARYAAEQTPQQLRNLATPGWDCSIGTAEGGFTPEERATLLRFVALLSEPRPAICGKP